MNINAFKRLQQTEESFDFFRLSKSKEAVDISPNTLRAYHRNGLPFYRRGKTVFISKTDLAQFIRANSDRSAFHASSASPQ